MLSVMLFTLRLTSLGATSATAPFSVDFCTPMTAFCVLAVPFAAHGFYDALAMSGQVDPVIGSVAFIALVWFCVKIHKLANRKVMAQLRKDEDEVFVVS